MAVSLWILFCAAIATPLRAARTAYLPTLALRFGASYQSGTNDFALWGDQDNYQYSTNVSVS